MKTPKSQMIERLVRISSTGLMTGTVTSLKMRHGARAVDLRRLDELVRHLRERGVDRDRDERQPAPDDQRRHHAELRERRRVPVVLEVVADVELGEDVVDDAVLEVRHPVPDLHRDDRRHRPDEHEPGGEEDPHQVETRTSSSAISVPSTIVRPTFATVKTTVRRSVCQKIGSWRTSAEVVQADVRARGAGSARTGRTARARAGRGCRSGSRGPRPSRRRRAATSRYGTEPRRGAARCGGRRDHLAVVSAAGTSALDALPLSGLRPVEGLRDVVARRRSLPA